MNAEQLVKDCFAAHEDALHSVRETRVESILLGARRCLRALLDERRLFACGYGASATNAQQLAIKLLGRIERERPGLPVFCLSEGAALASALSANYGSADVFARQLRALGQPGDVLIAFSASGMSGGTVQAIVAAHDRGMDVVAFTGGDGGDMARVLGEEDVEIRVPAASTARTEEIHLLLANVLCDVLERELFGDSP